ncbi:unnamed protein product, partial [Lymnaea stagnalis]
LALLIQSLLNYFVQLKLVRNLIMATIYTVTNPPTSNISRPKSSIIVDKNAQSNTPQTLRVFIDMDNVLCDLEQGLLKAFRRAYPREPYIPLDQRKGLNIRKQYSELRPDLGEKIYKIHCADGFLRDLPEVPGACDALKEMRKLKGIQIFIYSSPVTPYEHSLKEKCRWVEEHLGLEWLDKVIFVKDTTLLTGHVVIDDRISFKGCIKSPKWEHIVFSACHNSKCSIGYKKRLNNWCDGSWKRLILDQRKHLLASY